MRKNGRADGFDQIDCDNTKPNQSSFLDKPSSANDTSTGNACETNCQKPKEDELQTQPKSTLTPPQLPKPSVPLPSPQAEITRSGQVVKAPNKLMRKSFVGIA